MGCRALLTTAALVATLGVTAAPGIAQTSSDNRVLAQSQGGFNPTAVRSMLAEGDAAASRGDLAEARADYDKARKASKQLLAFYRDLSGAFRGLDARIPREMDTKGREALELLAETNLRLAAPWRWLRKGKVAQMLTDRLIGRQAMHLGIPFRRSPVPAGSDRPSVLAVSPVSSA